MPLEEKKLKLLLGKERGMFLPKSKNVWSTFNDRQLVSVFGGVQERFPFIYKFNEERNS